MCVWATDNEYLHCTCLTQVTKWQTYSGVCASPFSFFIIFSCTGEAHTGWSGPILFFHYLFMLPLEPSDKDAINNTDYCRFQCSPSHQFPFLHKPKRENSHVLHPFSVNTLPVLIAPQERVCTSDFISREDEQSQMKAELENRLTLPSRGDPRSTLSETLVLWKTNGGMCKTLKNCCTSYASDPAINLSSTISVGRRQEACEREMLRGKVAQRKVPLLFPFSRRRW